MYRLFRVHELGPKMKEQWIHGKVTSSKMQATKGPRKNLKWWTINFELPATKGIICGTQEVAVMKQAADDYREKKILNSLLVRN